MRLAKLQEKLEEAETALQQMQEESPSYRLRDMHRRCKESATNELTEGQRLMSVLVENSQKPHASGELESESAMAEVEKELWKRIESCCVISKEPAATAERIRRSEAEEIAAGLLVLEKGQVSGSST
jgi:hypothetical protein